MFVLLVFVLVLVISVVVMVVVIVVVIIIFFFFFSSFIPVKQSSHSWVLRVLIDAITSSDDCAGRFRTSASFYGVCVCGSE